MTYADKLRDPRWQKRRLEILQRDGWVCCECHDDRSHLHVDHRYYERGRDPWDYPDSALQTLCERCHARVGLERERAARVLGDMSLVTLNALVNAIARTREGTEAAGWGAILHPVPLADPPARTNVPELDHALERVRREMDEILAQPFTPALSLRLEELDEQQRQILAVAALVGDPPPSPPPPEQQAA